MFYLLALLWVVSGILCGYFSTESWMFKDRAFTFMTVVIGAFVGPFLVVTFFIGEGRRKYWFN